MKLKIMLAVTIVFANLVASLPVYGADSKACATYLFVGMRGSGEPFKDGITKGELGEPLSALYADLTKTSKFKALAYSGVSAYKAVPVAFTKEYFLELTQTSVSSLLEFLQAKSLRCPNTKFILAGYSQGAYAVRAATALIEDPSTPWGKLKPKIGAVVLLGDPGKPTSGVLFYIKEVIDSHILDAYANNAGRLRTLARAFPSSLKYLEALDAIVSTRPQVSKMAIVGNPKTIPYFLYDKPSDPVANGAKVLPSLLNRLNAMLLKFSVLEGKAGKEQLSLLGSDFHNLEKWHTTYNIHEFNIKGKKNAQYPFSKHQNFGFSIDATSWLVKNAFTPTSTPKPVPTPTSTPTSSTSNTSNAYKVGDTGPGGGKIFYVAPTSFACGPTLTSTCNYLEAAPTTGSAAWEDSGWPWSLENPVLIGATGTAIGTGYKNTLAMASQNSTAGAAGARAQAYRGPKGKSDWFLPSKDELAELYLRKATVGGIIETSYWSSSEVDRVFAWLQAFDYGYQNKYFKTYYGSNVRPVRAF